MKHLKYSAVGILILLVTVSSFPKSPKPSSNFAELEISATKPEYLLGEPVIIDTSLRIMGGGFVGPPNEWGSLAFKVAKGGGEFLSYEFQELYKRTGGHKSTDTIFFNRKPVTYHLSDYGRREAEKGRILTDYAFPEPGEYRIKSSFLLGRGPGGVSERIWSNEITIRVKEPKGDDLKVWQIMQSDLRIGFFMMEGEPTNFRRNREKGDTRRMEDSVLAEVDKVVADHPESYLAGLLKEKASQKRARRERFEQENERSRVHREMERATGTSKEN